MNVLDATASELLTAQAEGIVTAELIASVFLAAVRQNDTAIHAFLHLDEEDALRQARRVDERRRGGEPLGPLAGLPVALKDALCTRGLPTTCGSRMLEKFVPPYDATVVARLREADAVIFGKTNMDEFAMGSSTENSAFFPTRNPWDRRRTPGGSSGGSAAAVAMGMTPLAIGSDTGGSIRQPAAFCGVVGVKPTYGRVSRYGLVAFASSLDQIGPFGRTVGDAAVVLETIAGHDPRDSTSADLPVPPYTLALDQPVKNLAIGLPREFFDSGLDAEVERAVRDAVRVYEQLGARIVDVSLPHARYGIAAYYLVATAEASGNLARFDGMHYGHRTERGGGLIETVSRSRSEAFGREVQRRIMLGTYALSSGYRDAYYLKALQVRRLIKNDFDQAFERCDVLLGPTTPTPAFRLGEKIDDPLAMYLSDVHTIGCNLAGLPGLNVPCGFTSGGLPIGMQLLAAPFEEAKLLRVARMYEKETGWSARRPAR